MADLNLIAVPLLGWPFSVLSTLSSPPGSPTLNDCHIVGSSPTGAWSGHTNAIARWNASSAWEFQTPTEGRAVWNVATDVWLMWNGSAWVNANPLPAGGTTGQTLSKTSNSDYAIGWGTITGTGPTQIWYFANSGTLTNASGVIGDIAIVGGSIDNLYYKDASNVWTLGGPLAGASGDITAVTAGTAMSGGGTSGSVTLNVDVHAATLKATPTTSDELLIADAAASNVVKRVTVGSLPFTNVTFGTSGSTACVGNDSRLSDDRTASGIRTASTVVSVSAATAPSSGQVLQASSSTAASWVTPASASTTIKKAGTTIGTRGAVNFIEGSNVTITATDNSGSDRVDVTIASSGSGSSFAILTDINPYNLWDADHVATTSGSVDTITDQGTGGKNFTASGSNRCTVGTDGNGKNYLAPDGTDDFYQAGAAADWKWLHDGTTPWTIGGVWDLTGMGGNKFFLDTSDGSTANTGFHIGALYSSATSMGIDSYLSRGGSPLAIRVDGRPNITGVTTWSLRFLGDHNSANTTTVMEYELWLGGRRIGTSVRGSSPSTSNPTGTLTLFRRITTTTNPFSGKMYQLWTVKKAVPERIMQAWAADVATRYVSTG